MSLRNIIIIISIVLIPHFSYKIGRATYAIETSLPGYKAMNDNYTWCRDAIDACLTNPFVCPEIQYDLLDTINNR